MYNIYESANYREYLRSRLGTTGSQRGLRTKLADHINCRLGYVSNVLTGIQDFSFEQGALICDFLELSTPETEFFMLLLHKERAGNYKLKAFYEQQIKKILDQRDKIKSRVNKSSEGLDEKQKAIFYSSWLPSAIHVLSSIPEFQNDRALANKLKVSVLEVKKVLDFLFEVEILKGTHQNIQQGNRRIHLESHSPHVKNLHSNWRLKALDSIENEILNSENDQEIAPLHYSLAMSLSKKDIKRIRKFILELIENTETVLTPSKEETGAVLNIDLFSL